MTDGPRRQVGRRHTEGHRCGDFNNVAWLILVLCYFGLDTA